MADVYLEWNNDLVLTPNGDVQTATGWDEIRQRIVRRLITNSARTLPDGSTTAPDYVFHPGYGEGLGALVGQNPDSQFAAAVTARINAAVLVDTAVDPGAVPVVSFSQPQPGTWIVYIKVNLANRQSGIVSVRISQ